MERSSAQHPKHPTLTVKINIIQGTGNRCHIQTPYGNVPASRCNVRNVRSIGVSRPETSDQGPFVLRCRRVSDVLCDVLRTFVFIIINRCGKSRHGRTVTSHCPPPPPSIPASREVQKVLQTLRTRSKGTASCRDDNGLHQTNCHLKDNKLHDNASTDGERGDAVR